MYLSKALAELAGQWKFRTATYSVAGIGAVQQVAVPDTGRWGLWVEIVPLSPILTAPLAPDPGVSTSLSVLFDSTHPLRIDYRQWGRLVQLGWYLQSTAVQATDVYVIEILLQE